MGFFGRKRSTSSTSTPAAPPPDLTKAQIKLATRTRKRFALLTSFFLFLTVLFIILVELGGIFDKAVIRNWYFIRLDLSHIIPASVPNFALINTIAQTLGLHDFYQVGLWGVCEGYQGDGVTFCSKPQTLYWFNPVEIIGNELLAGASINLPNDINDILNLIKLASQVMFGLFLTSACLSFILMFIVPLSVFSRWATLPIAIITFLNALFVTVASVVATVMFVIFRNVIGSVQELNIKAEIGNYLFGFMWTASAFAIFAWLIQTSLCCCCASRRDIKTGRKRGNAQAQQTDGANAVAPNADGNAVQEKPTGRRRFRFGKKSV
ncbi:SUR7/PalI family-domain-containing protein [Massariosphaeria phaeospora]|uniref:SUR7/PalI family-domain-containing protein n=1 Tax=Massariosphaeria phaeospora TaxID=100035 RepID=A0A7C8MDD5_9PLEO|nr:SUR7/PalI family-domain-containing protein [Massariosphaeria phaeospora]